MGRIKYPTALKWVVGAAAAFYFLLIIVPFGIFLSLDAFEISGADGRAAVKIRQRDFWEIVYFITNAFLVIVALIALIFAFRQSIAAHSQSDAANRQNEMALRNAQAQVYLSMETKFTSQELVESRKMMVTLRSRLTPLATEDKPLGALVNEELQILLKDGSNLEEYVKYIRLLTFIESIGLMARREYVSLDDIYYLLESVLLGFDRMFMDHIRARQKDAAERGNANPGRIYEHTIWLVEKMKDYKPTHPLSP